MAADEEDYMSETFLRGLDDVRPGLKPPSRKRRASIPKAGSDKGAAAATRAKQRKMHEKAARQEGLSRPLSEDNKGFSMLMRMGFKEGEGLGKLGQLGLPGCRTKGAIIQNDHGCDIIAP